MNSDPSQRRGGRGGGLDSYRGGSMQGSSRGDAKAGYQGRGGYLGATQATTAPAYAGGAIGMDGNSPSVAADE